MELSMRNLVGVARNNVQFYHSKGLARSAIAGFLTGCGFAFGLVLVLFHFTAWGQFGGYLAALGFFHFGEFFVTALFHPDTVNFDSFLLNHSKMYGQAVAMSFAEYFVESFFFPSWKSWHLVSYVGFLMLVSGQSIRTLAMLTAGANFTHLVADQKRPDHQLVTSGIYSFCRHPSYCGWFMWTVGTQLLLCNPICVVGYSIVAWRFFKARIEYEEERLVEFFGEQYTNYQARVWSGVPLI